METKSNKTLRFVLTALYSLILFGSVFDYLETGYGDGFYHIGKIFFIVMLGSAIFMLARKNWRFVFPCSLIAGQFLISKIFESNQSNAANFFGVIMGVSFQFTLIFLTFKSLKLVENKVN